MQRFDHDLSHYSSIVGKIGRLQTLDVTQVYANDSIGMSVTGNLRLSPLRNQMLFDCKADIFTFFVPHRHVYGKAWTDMISEGMESTTVLPSVAKTGQVPQNIQFEYIHGGNIQSTSGQTNVPLCHVAGYAKIWNEYFRIPNVTPAANGIPEDALPVLDAAGLQNVQYGFNIARIPSFSTGSVASKVEDTYRQADVTDGKIDLLSLAQAGAQYDSKKDREWYAHRYRDLMPTSFGSKKAISIDVDDRPQLIYRQTEWLSGHDIDGSDDATLGSVVGKSQMMVNYGFPLRYFNEHGLLWTVMVLRLPTNPHRSINWLVSHTSDPSYKTFTGDPRIHENEPPTTIKLNELYGVAEETVLGNQPYGNQDRTHINHVHYDFVNVSGFPFVQPPTVGDLNKQAYENSGDYDNIFQSQQLAHWNFVSKIEMPSKRNIPPAAHSLNAGASITK